MMSARSKLLALATSVALAIAAAPATAVISIATPSFTYSQNFNSLPIASATWTNDSTLAGWSLFTAAGSAIGTIFAGNGSSNSGGFWTFGSSNATDRALGGTGSGGTYFGTPASGAVAGYIAVAFTNFSATAYNSFTVGFDGEQWRDGGNPSASAQTMALQYGFGATFGQVASWTTPGDAFNWTSPVKTTTAAALDGNLAANRVTGVGGTVVTPWAAGQTLWVRWVENNDVGNDHGLAIDNFSLSVTAVPEADMWAMMLAGLGLIGFIGRRRSK